MPSGVERALADSLSLEHPDVPWTLPAVLPSTSDLRAALEVLEAQMAPATRKHVAWCLAKLSLAFEPTSRLSGEDTNLRASIWLEACGDLGDELWSQATLAVIQSSKWMPKPSEFRAFVAAKFEERAKRLKRCREMLSGVRAGPEKPAAFIAEPLDVRVRSMRDSFKRVGKILKATQYERELAGLENREIEEWARDVQVEPPKGEERPPFKPEATPSAKHCADLARAFHEKAA